MKYTCNIHCQTYEHEFTCWWWTRLPYNVNDVATKITRFKVPLIIESIVAIRQV